MAWQITCVDTMKDSMDTCFPVTNQLDALTIAQAVNLCATLSVTHITVDCYYDYADYMALWVAAVRATGKNVWFRCHWNAWQGNNGASATLTPTTYITATQAFIIAHPTLFQAGDIFDSCPEPDNSSYWVTTYGAGYTNGAPTAGTNAFNQFLLNLDSQLQATLQNAGIQGVNTKIHSLNSFWAKTTASLYPSTVAALGYVCLDSYPEGSSTDPNTCAAARLAELQQIASARPGVNIIISEMGYSNSVTVSDSVQQAVLAAELAAIATVPTVVGLNYWVGPGTETSGGHTHLFAGARDSYTLRPAASTLATFFRTQLQGFVNLSDVNVTISGVTVSVAAKSFKINNAIGQRSTCSFDVQDLSGTLSFQRFQPVIITAPINGQTTRLYAGIVWNADRKQVTLQSRQYVITITCADWHTIADRRIVATSYANQTCGFMARDIVTNYLASEGVTYQRGVNKFTAQQSDVESSDMTAFSKGSSVTISQDTTAANVYQGSGALKVVTGGGTHTFEQIEVHADATPFAQGQSVTISCYAKVSTGTATLRYFLQSDTGAIGGTVNITLTTTYQRFTKTVTLPTPFTNNWIGLRLDTGSPAQAITFWLDNMQIEIGAAVTAFEIGGLAQSVYDGPTVTSYIANYKPASTAFDDLALLAGFYCQIDANKVLWFAPYSAVSAPLVFTGSIAEFGSMDVLDGNDLYRNGQWVLGTTEVTATQTETRQGDGKATAFLMSYPLHAVPTITLNSGAQTVGIKGVDTGKNWYWNKSDATISQDTSGTKLISTDTLQVVYIGEFDTVIFSEDAAQQTATAALEGVGTGLVEAVATDTTLVTSAQAFQSAAALLAKYAQAAKTLTFATRVSGLAQGQLLSVNLPSPWNISNAQLLIEQVAISEIDMQLLWTVTAMLGPVNDTWVQFFARIINQQGVIDTATAGANQTVTILQTGLVAWTWTVTGSATVVTYAFPSPTRFPSPTNYPGTAGTPVAITWTKTNAGLNALRDALSGAGSTLAVKYVAWGTSTQGTPATATQLAHEVGRKAITSLPNGAAVGELLMNGIISPQDAVGVAITEVAFFAGPGASATANTGIMLLYGLYSHTHTNAESIQIQADATLS